MQRLEDATQQGIEECKRVIVESLLQVKFGEIDQELAKIIEPLIELETLDRTRLIMQLDRSQLLAHFDTQNQTES